MGKRRFAITLEAEAVIELDDAVINVVDDEWRASLYDLYTPEEIAEMVGRMMIAHHYELSQIDGWVDQPDENAKVIDIDWNTTDINEIKSVNHD